MSSEEGRGGKLTPGFLAWHKFFMDRRGSQLPGSTILPWGSPCLGGPATPRRMTVSWAWTVWERAHCRAHLDSFPESTTTMILLPGAAAAAATCFPPLPPCRHLSDSPGQYPWSSWLPSTAPEMRFDPIGGDRTLTRVATRFRQKLGSLVPVLTISKVLATARGLPLSKSQLASLPS